MKPKDKHQIKEDLLVDVVLSGFFRLRKHTVNIFLGVAIILALVGLGFWYLVEEEKKGGDAWYALANATDMADLLVVLEEYEGTDAEPWILYQLGIDQMDDGDLEGAKEAFAFLRDRYSKHFIVQGGFLAAAERILQKELEFEPFYDLDEIGFVEPPPEEPSDEPTYDIVDEGEPVRVALETEKGEIHLELFEEEAPNTVANFVRLIQSGFYKDLEFHRVEKEPEPFVIQTGDPTGTGRGGPGYRIPFEENDLKHLEGSVAMARAGDDLDSGGSQFYICLSEQPSLDGKYTVFGKVARGLNVIHQIEKGDEVTRIRITSLHDHPYLPKKAD